LFTTNKNYLRGVKTPLKTKMDTFLVLMSELYTEKLGKKFTKEPSLHEQLENYAKTDPGFQVFWNDVMWDVIDSEPNTLVIGNKTLTLFESEIEKIKKYLCDLSLSIPRTSF
jgi:hypothetical protein